jgi:hypothetical protein
MDGVLLFCGHAGSDLNTTIEDRVFNAVESV